MRVGARGANEAQRNCFCFLLGSEPGSGLLSSYVGDIAQPGMDFLQQGTTVVVVSRNCLKSERKLLCPWRAGSATAGGAAAAIPGLCPPWRWHSTAFPPWGRAGCTHHCLGPLGIPAGSLQHSRAGLGHSGPKSLPLHPNPGCQGREGLQGWAGALGRGQGWAGAMARVRGQQEPQSGVRSGQEPWPGSGLSSLGR